MTRRMGATVLVLTLWAVTAHGAVPSLVNYQGIITNPGGVPVPGAHNVVFSLYDDPTAGNLLWTETNPITADVYGRFNVLLGSVSPLHDSLFAGADRYLALTVDGDPEMDPRIRIVTVAYAFRLATVDGATGGNITSAITVGPGHLGTGTSSFIAGESDTAGGHYSTIGGGSGNLAGEVDTVGEGTEYQVVGGGFRNKARGSLSMIGGGELNQTLQSSTTICGGSFNLADGGKSTVVGGKSNIAGGIGSFIGGGGANRAYGNFSVVVGGGGTVPESTPADSNVASGDYSFIGGGRRNNAASSGASIVGGDGNLSGVNSFVGGGDGNSAEGTRATIGGGSLNTATNYASTIAGGEQSIASGIHAAICGGFSDTASGQRSFIGGGGFNVASGVGATVAGGGGSVASGTYTSIGGGVENEASAQGGTVPGGYYNMARGSYSVVGGGGGLDALDSNSALGDYSTIIGGRRNIVSGDHATVCGGFKNSAIGAYSLAAGRSASAAHNGTFVWSDASTDIGFASTASNEFSARCVAGARFVSAVDGGGVPTAGVTLAGGGGSWSSISDRNAKENITEVDAGELLLALARVPVARWNYKSQSPAIRHIGPMAQDFYAAFGVGEDDRHITTIDADGVALAAIQALYQRNQELEEAVTRMKGQLDRLEAALKNAGN